MVLQRKETYLPTQKPKKFSPQVKKWKALKVEVGDMRRSLMQERKSLMAFSPTKSVVRKRHLRSSSVARGALPKVL